MQVRPLVRRARLKFPEPAPMPVTWFARLTRALATADPRLERIALDELETLGFHVTVHRQRRRDAAQKKAPGV